MSKYLTIFSEKFALGSAVAISGENIAEISLIVPNMVQIHVKHVSAVVMKFNTSLNRGERCISLNPTQVCSLKCPEAFLARATYTNKSGLLPIKYSSLLAFSKSPTNRIKTKFRYSAKDVTVGGRSGLQEAQVSNQAEEDKDLKYLTSGYGWKVRFLNQEREEMEVVAEIQAAAFHVPSPIWDSFFFMLFKVEVLCSLQYSIRDSLPNRFACLVAESDDHTVEYGVHGMSEKNLAGVVDVTARVDEDVLCHLEGAAEYLYVSGIAVRLNYRRRKVATLLLKACDFLAFLWGFDYLVLRAYEDDVGARTLYARAGYKVVSQDPPWASTWIGRKQRVLMVKRASNEKLQG